jgi:hypothetical protein
MELKQNRKKYEHSMHEKSINKILQRVLLCNSPEKKELESKAFNNVEFFYVVCTTNGKKYRAIDETKN